MVLTTEQESILDGVRRHSIVARPAQSARFIRMAAQGILHQDIPMAGFRRNAAWPCQVHWIKPVNLRAVVEVILHRRPLDATAVEYANAAESSSVDVRHFFGVRGEPLQKFQFSVLGDHFFQAVVDETNGEL